MDRMAPPITRESWRALAQLVSESHLEGLVEPRNPFALNIYWQGKEISAKDLATVRTAAVTFQRHLPLLQRIDEVVPCDLLTLTNFPKSIRHSSSATHVCL